MSWINALGNGWDAGTLGVLGALVAGLTVALSPSSLPLIPVITGYVLGAEQRRGWPRLVAFLAGIVVALSLVIISKRAVRGDPRDRTLRRLAHRFIRRWGTQFVNADLTSADFTGADARNCDARGATVTDVEWDPRFPTPVDVAGTESI